MPKLTRAEPNDDRSQPTADVTIDQYTSAWNPALHATKPVVPIGTSVRIRADEPPDARELDDFRRALTHSGARLEPTVQATDDEGQSWDYFTVVLHEEAPRFRVVLPSGYDDFHDGAEEWTADTRAEAEALAQHAVSLGYDRREVSIAEVPR